MRVVGDDRAPSVSSTAPARRQPLWATRERGFGSPAVTTPHLMARADIAPNP